MEAQIQIAGQTFNYDNCKRICFKGYNESKHKHSFFASIKGDCLSTSKFKACDGDMILCKKPKNDKELMGHTRKLVAFTVGNNFYIKELHHTDFLTGQIFFKYYYPKPTVIRFQAWQLQEIFIVQEVFSKVEFDQMQSE